VRWAQRKRRVRAPYSGTALASGRALCCRAFALLAPLAVATPAFSEEPGGPEPARGLTIAILDLAEIPDLMPRPAAETRRPAWRTTFGSERESPPEVKAHAAAGPIAALGETDAVLIQGVQAAAPLRRLFPPRTWRLIVSRKVLSLSDPVGLRTVRSDLPPSTAIAVRAHQNLRVTARALTLRLEPSPPGQPPGDTEAAATAVRLVDRGGRTLWLASVALPASCSTEDPPCTALGTLDAWRQDKLRNGEPTVIGGRISVRAPPKAETADAASAACSSHTIESDLAWHRLPPRSGPDSSQDTKGCVEIVRLAE
jgi:hypothetical protein